MNIPLRILLLADSHIGFDLASRPRVARRRRGHDFLANHEAALAPALAGEVDAVVHGGDVFHRSRVPASLGWQALDPLVRVAERGVPVFVVPGNHERSRLPHARFASHPNVHVFDRPGTFVVDVRGTRVALSGFPFERGDVRTRFPALLGRTGWNREAADVRLLCMHQCVEGATVGPGDFTFTTARDVVRAQDLPPEFAAVLSGHIHRHQVLTRDLSGEPLVAPVLYPGSLERTSLAEIGEPKGYLLLQLSGAGRAARRGVARWQFRELPSRPMIVTEIAAAGLTAAALESAVRAAIAVASPDAVLRIRITGAVDDDKLYCLRAARLRAFAPDTMNVDIRLPDGALPLRRSEANNDRNGRRRAGRADRRAARAGAHGQPPGIGPGEQLDLMAVGS